MPQFADRVKVTTTSGTAFGTGAITLSSTAVSGYQAFPSSLDGETVGYVIESGSAWEIGTGTYTHSSLNLTRSLRSSSTGSLLSLAAGTHTVFLTPAYQDIQIVEAFSSTSDLPSASDNHGRIYHVHGEGAMYFAHAGSWVKLANYSDITTYTHPNHSGEVTSTGDGATVIADDVVDEANLKVSNTPTDGYVLTARSSNTGGMTWEAASGGIALTDLSVTQNTASGSGTLSYDNTSGVFSYTPPVISGGSTGSALTEQEFTATAGQTVFTVTGGITNADNVVVFLNGSRLADNDINAISTSAGTVTLNAAATVGDLVTVSEFGAAFGSQYSSTIFTVGTSSEFNTSTKVLTTSYTANRVAVYLNGVKLLVGTDCTATNGSTIDLTNAAPVTGDKIEVVEHGTLADTVTTLTGLSDTPSSLGTAGQILQVNSGATALEFADASGGGVTVYDNTGDLPSSGNTDGDLAWVKDVTGSGALKAFYIWDGSAWKRVPTGTDQGPLITTEPPTSQLNLQTTSTVTMVASDPEGFPVTYSIDYNTTNNALPSQLSAATSINQSTGVFTFTPSTSASNNGTFKARLNASDGARSTSRFVDFLLNVKQSQKSTSTNWYFAPAQMWTDQTTTSNVVTKLFFTRIGSNLIYEWAVSNDDISTLTNASTMSNTDYGFAYAFYDAGSVSVDGSKLLCSYQGYIYGYSFSTPFDRTSCSYDGRVYSGSTSHSVSALWYDNGNKIRYQNSDAVYTASASTAYDITTVGSFTSSSPAAAYRKTPNQQWAVPSTAEAGNDSDATIADLYYGYWTTTADYGVSLRYGTAANYSNSPTFNLTGTNALGGSSNPFTGTNFDRGKILFVSPDGSEIFVYADNSSGNNQTSNTASRRIARYKLNTAGTLAQLSDVASF